MTLLGRRLNGIQEVDGSIPFGSTATADLTRFTQVRLFVSISLSQQKLNVLAGVGHV
jgi:hypothetical protein